MHFSILLSVALLATGAFSSTSYHFNPLEHLAGVAPPFDPLDPPLDPSPPQGCNVTRAAYLIRHAAIYANDFDYETYIEPFVQKLSNTTVDWSNVPVLSFLATWKNPITDAEQEMLTRAGKLEATKLGVNIAQKYQSLRIPEKIWASTAERTVKSAKSFTQGLALDARDVEVVEVSEGEEEGADSLTPYDSCPAYSSSAGSKEASVGKNFSTKFTPLTSDVGISQHLHQTSYRTLQLRCPGIQLHSHWYLRHVPSLWLRDRNSRLLPLLQPRRRHSQRMARIWIHKRHHVFL